MVPLVAAAALAAARAPLPALEALGLGALRWNEPAAEITPALPDWRPDTGAYQPSTLLTPGREAVVALGLCRFTARFMGARGALTHVELHLADGERSACARLMLSRLGNPLGAPRPPSSSRSSFRSGKITGYALQEPFWDGRGETASLIEWGPPIDSLSMGATADGDEAVTVR